jgi:3-deoxy-D-manno-octulosonate 8-phosphate phosphatase (KDO 8-P phosphatase)
VSAARDVAARARRVKLLVTDVDGVLTDGRMLLSERGDELKAFHARDGVAVELARRGGLRTAMVTGERATIAKTRGDKLGVDAVVLGARRKGETIAELCARFDLGPEAVAYIGDDLLDVPALQRVGLAFAVADAPAEVRAAAHAVTRAAGGQGVLRECVERILRAQRTWDTVIAGFLRDHGGGAPRGG